MSKISDNDVLNLAKLSKLNLTSDEVKKFKVEIEEILTYVEQLQDANTDNLEPTNQVTGLNSVMRPDEIKTFTDPSDLLANLPDREENLIKVQKVL